MIKTRKHCYVCGKTKPIPTVYVGDGKYRHTKCKPGSKSYIKKFGKEDHKNGNNVKRIHDETEE